MTMIMVVAAHKLSIMLIIITCLVLFIFILSYCLLERKKKKCCRDGHHKNCSALYLGLKNYLSRLKNQPSSENKKEIENIDGSGLF